MNLNLEVVESHSFRILTIWSNDFHDRRKHYILEMLFRSYPVSEKRGIFVAACRDKPMHHTEIQQQSSFSKAFNKSGFLMCGESGPKNNPITPCPDVHTTCLPIKRLTGQILCDDNWVLSRWVVCWLTRLGIALVVHVSAVASNLLPPFSSRPSGGIYKNSTIGENPNISQYCLVYRIQKNLGRPPDGGRWKLRSDYISEYKLW